MALILIVDDQVDACRPLALLLRRIGHQAVCRTSGEAALAYLQQQCPDLMLLDVMMPGMDGMEVLRQIRADRAFDPLPIAMFSAVSDPTFQEHARSKGANDYWVKACISYDQLQHRVAALLAPPAPPLAHHQSAPSPDR